MFLSDFQSIRPRFESSQTEALNWLVQAHTIAGACSKELETELFRVGCKSDSISKRGHVLNDFLHHNWDEMQIYRLTEKAAGESLAKRSQVFETEVDLIFDQFYSKGTMGPDDLIHVSCTG